VARYANNSNYRNDSLIRKESMSELSIAGLTYELVCVSPAVISELRRIVENSEIMKYFTSIHFGKRLTRNREDDVKWPKRNKDGRQELEIRLGNKHISFDVSLPLLATLEGQDFLPHNFFGWYG